MVNSIIYYYIYDYLSVLAPYIYVYMYMCVYVWCVCVYCTSGGNNTLLITQMLQKFKGTTH